MSGGMFVEPLKTKNTITNKIVSQRSVRGDVYDAMEWDLICRHLLAVGNQQSSSCKIYARSNVMRETNKYNCELWKTEIIF